MVKRVSHNQKPLKMIDLCSTATVVQCFFVCASQFKYVIFLLKSHRTKRDFHDFLLGFFNFFSSLETLRIFFLRSSFMFGLLFGYQIKLFMQNINFLFNHKFLISAKNNRKNREKGF